jgi:formylmethanofuran dehydrogenase subunit E
MKTPKKIKCIECFEKFTKKEIYISMGVNLCKKCYKQNQGFGQKN